MHPFTKDLRAPLFVLTTCALAVSSVARAAEPTFEEHMAKFKHATVVNAPEQASTASSIQSGLKAYIDPATGALRGPTQEELDANASQAAPSTARFRSAARSSSAMSSQNAPMGGTKVMLDDSMMQFSVVTRQADGSISEICTTGDEHAEHAVKTGIVAASKGELQ